MNGNPTTAALGALQQFDGRLAEDDNLVAVSFKLAPPRGEIELRFTSIQGTDWVPETIDVEGTAISVSKRPGVPWVDLIAFIDSPPADDPDAALAIETFLRHAPDGQALGGVACFNESFRRKTGKVAVGTAGLFVSSTAYDDQSRSAERCKTARTAFITCHHVLAVEHGSTIGRIGDTVAIRDDKRQMLLDFAEFSCGPDSEALDVNVDYAAAAVHTTNRTPVLIGEVSHLGRTRGVREPQVSFGSGGPVKKVGARTGFTKGEIVAISSGKTRSGKRINTVFEVEGPSDSYFACEGDSGSVVVDDDGYILGILSWGDSVQCGEAGSSYFWAFEHANRAGKQFTFHVDL